MKQFATDQFKNGNKDQVFGKKSNESYDCGWIDDQEGNKSPLVMFRMNMSTIDLSNVSIEGVTLGHAYNSDNGNFIINDTFQISGSDIDSIAFNEFNPMLAQGYALRITDYSEYKKYTSVGNSLRLVINMQEGHEISFTGYKPNTAQNNEITGSASTLVFNIVDMHLIKNDYEDEQHEIQHVELISLTLSPMQNFIENGDDIYRPVFVSNTIDIEIPVNFMIFE